MEALKGTVALITGAGSGIGRAITLRLAEMGATLAIVGRRAEPLDALAAAIRARGGMISPYSIDITADSAVTALASGVRRDCGAVDIVIHSAGTIELGPLASAPLAAFDRQYRTNVRAPLALTQALLPDLRARGGQIVFINSSAGLAVGVGNGQYAATKFALRAVADSLRAELTDTGIRVLSVYPGRTASPMQAAIHAAEGRHYVPEGLLQPDDIALAVASALALPRTAEVTDLHIRPQWRGGAPPGGGRSR